jgi:hypothetical protein
MECVFFSSIGDDTPRSLPVLLSLDLEVMRRKTRSAALSGGSKADKRGSVVIAAIATSGDAISVLCRASPELKAKPHKVCRKGS